MTANDLALVVKGIAPVLREYVALRVDGLLAQVAELEQRLIAAERKALNLDDVAVRAAALVPVPKDGRDAEPVDLDALARKAAALIPVPKDGQDGQAGRDGQSVDADELSRLIESHLAKAVESIRVTAELSVAPLVAAEVERAVASLPAPEDGKSVTADDVAPLIAAEVTKAVAGIPPPKDGAGVMGALIDRAGHLVLTLSDGATKDLGPVVGEVDMAIVAKTIADEVAKIPAPRDGKDGRDGSIDGIKAIFDGERTVTFCFPNGEPMPGGTLYLPIPIYRGVFTDEKAYVVNDVVTWGGAMWIAKSDTSDRPGMTNDTRAWQLCVKEGRKGKDGIPGEPGKPGRDGKDLTVTDRKW